jgi:cell division septal protein FtsQ
MQGGFWELCFLFFFLHLVFLLWFILLGLLGSFQLRLFSLEGSRSLISDAVSGGDGSNSIFST